MVDEGIWAAEGKCAVKSGRLRREAEPASVGKGCLGVPFRVYCPAYSASELLTVHVETSINTSEGSLPPLQSLDGIRIDTISIKSYHMMSLSGRPGWIRAAPTLKPTYERNFLWLVSRSSNPGSYWRACRTRSACPPFPSQTP